MKMGTESAIAMSELRGDHDDATPFKRLKWHLCFSRRSCRAIAQIRSVHPPWPLPTFSSPLLSSVRILNIEKDYSSELPTGEEDVDSTQWLELFQQFSHVRLVSVDVEQLVQGIVQALVTEDVAEGILPELTSLGLGGFASPDPWWKLSSSSSLRAGSPVAR